MNPVEVASKLFTSNEPATAEHPVMYFDEHGNGPFFHVCRSMEPVVEWLDRQRLLGLISPEGAAAVERLIEDLR